MTRLRVIVAMITLAFLYLIYPLVLPIAMGGVLAVLFSPWMVFLEKRKIGSPVSSAILTFGISIVLIFPMSVLVFFAAKTGFRELQGWKSTSDFENNGILRSFLEMPKVHYFMVWVTDRVPVEISQVSETFVELARSVGSRIAEFLGNALTQLPGMATSLLLIVVSVYFFLLERQKLIQFVRRNSIFSFHQTNQLIETAEEVCRSVVLAALVSGGVQALLEILACIFTSTPNVRLIGLLVFVGSFIPLVGSAPITLTLAVHQFVMGQEGAGIVLLMMSITLLAIDNAIRPLFLRGTANLHPFLAFIAAFGGLQTVGFLGVFLGPILAALFVALIRILEAETAPVGS